MGLGEGELAAVEAVGALDAVDEVAELCGEVEDAGELVVCHGSMRRLLSGLPGYVAGSAVHFVACFAHVLDGGVDDPCLVLDVSGEFGERDNGAVGWISIPG